MTTSFFKIENEQRKGNHVHFTLYTNGAKCGDLCMRHDEFEAFKMQVLNKETFQTAFNAGVALVRIEMLMASGWKIFDIGQHMFYTKENWRYEYKADLAADLGFEEAKAEVDEENKQLKSQNSEIVGREALLVYDPKPDFPNLKT